MIFANVIFSRTIPGFSNFQNLSWIFPVSRPCSGIYSRFQQFTFFSFLFMSRKMLQFPKRNNFRKWIPEFRKPFPDHSVFITKALIWNILEQCKSIFFCLNLSGLLYSLVFSIHLFFGGVRGGGIIFFFIFDKEMVR